MQTLNINNKCKWDRLGFIIEELDHTILNRRTVGKRLENL